jgi:hypothetical protein
LTYGDNAFDEPEHERILFHNINGMKNDDNWFQIITTMQELNITIFGFAELNQTLTRSYNSKWKPKALLPWNQNTNRAEP